MNRITLINQKGGVGKTTTAAFCSSELALRGYKVLVIDGDPQSNLKRFFSNGKIDRTLDDFLLGERAEYKSIKDVAVKTEIENLDLVASSQQLNRFNKRESEDVVTLRNSLLDIDGEYDFVIIDTTPGMGMLQTSALIASEHLLIPVQADPLAVTGLTDVFRTAQHANKIYRDTQILGIFCTLLDERTAIGKSVVKTVKEGFPELAFQTSIHMSVAIKECSATHKPIQLHAPKSRAREEYSSLTEEFLKRLKMPTKKKSHSEKTKSQKGSKRK